MRANYPDPETLDKAFIILTPKKNYGKKLPCYSVRIRQGFKEKQTVYSLTVIFDIKKI